MCKHKVILYIFLLLFTYIEHRLLVKCLKTTVNYTEQNYLNGYTNVYLIVNNTGRTYAKQ